MCYYQNIHTAYHFTLLGFDPCEREHHSCQLVYPGWEPAQGKCPLHSCCSVRRILIVQCSEDRDAGVREGAGSCEICPHAFIEDVFVPLPKGKKRVLIRLGEEARGEIRAGTGTGVAHRDRHEYRREDEDEDGDGVVHGPLMMEFWLDDQPGVLFRVFLDELEAVGDGYYVWTRSV
ncbi:hypothetical protein GGR51DRAFT_281969 [Nemania sp. FL0031]|nr:hypothetical protein GGR51DRAFT_281969 [Nemania sp. FL0031]